MSSISDRQPMVTIRSRLPRQQLAIYAFYLAVAILITWPLVTVMSTQLVGDDTSDAYEMGRHIWWFKHALQTGQPLFFQPLLGYPDGITGISLWADPLQFFPAWLFAFIMPIPSAYNLTILLTMALNGWTMYWLMQYLLSVGAGLKRAPAENVTPIRINIPALIAGLVFMLFPTMQGHLLGGHAGLLVMWPVPLYVYALLRLLETPNRRWLATSVLFFILSPAGHALQVIYVLLPITGLLMLTLFLKRDWTGFGRVLLVALLGGLGLLAFLLPVMSETVDTAAYVDEIGNVRYSADLLGIVSPSFRHPFFGKLDYPARVLGINLVEGSTYIGIIAGILALVGVVRRRAARWWLGLAALAWVLSLGPLLKIFDQPVVFQTGGYKTYIPLPLALVENLPFFSLGRSPGRFAFTLALAVAALAGYGAEVIFRPLPNSKRGINPRRWFFAGIVLAGIVWEYQFFWPVPTVSGVIPDAVANLRERADVRAVFDIPWENPLAIKDGLYLQTAHQKPMVGGQVTRQTPVSPAKLILLQTLSPALLKGAGADIVILHKQRAASMGVLDKFIAQAQAQLGAPFYQDDRLAVYEVPDGTTAAEFTVLASSSTDYADSADSYLYTPEPGWVDLAMIFRANDRDVALYLDDQRLSSWHVNGYASINIPLPVASRGYHTIRLALDPPCPLHIDETLACRTLFVSSMAFSQLTSGAIYEPVELKNGLELAASYVPRQVQIGDSLPVRLWWRFDQPRHADEVRFVHVFDASGKFITQFDSAIGNEPANGEWAERLDIRLPDSLPPGYYTVYTGWYTFADRQRFAILSPDVPGAENDLIELGIFRLG